MSEWTIVMWSAAHQIAREAGLPADIWPEEGIAPQDYFRILRADENPFPALSYAATALPKLEAIDWSLHALPSIDQDHPDYADRQLLRDAAHRWVGEPDDDNRRAMYDLAENASTNWPETMIGLAIFFSGGSIAPAENDAVGADDKVCASLISGALRLAVANHIKTEPELANRALDLADTVATSGREALATT